jgi:hypothetical protein
MIYLSRLFARHINHTLTPVMITIVEISNTQTLIECDAAHHNSSESPKIPDTKAMMEFLEDPDSFLSDYTGEDNIPLHDIYHKSVNPQIDDDDPRNGYASAKAEMIACAPYTLPAYTVDNTAIAKILKEMVVGFKDGIIWARDSFHNRDGPAVMSNWMVHFCGTARQETVGITAEATMNNTSTKARNLVSLSLNTPTSIVDATMTLLPFIVLHRVSHG